MDQTWKYSTIFNLSAPVISVELAGATLECFVDTGFSGGLMIPLSTSESLGLMGKPRFGGISGGHASVQSLELSAITEGCRPL